MGIFEDEAALMRKEASAAILEEEKQLSAWREIAQTLSDELASYTGTIERPDVAVSVDQDKVLATLTLADRTASIYPDHILTIYCRGPNAFEISGHNVEEGKADKKTMIRRVIGWLDRSQPH